MKDQDQLLDLQTTDSFRLYLDEVGRHPLLTKEDEIALSQAYEAGLDAQLRLAEAHYGVRRGARMVGRAMARCPGDVPWWRVVHADGTMKGTPGADEQRARLADEGVPLTRDGRVDWAGAGGPWSP